jgi:hypothetical protein
LIQENRIVRFENPNGPIFTTLEAGFAISVFSQEDVEGDFWTRSWLASLVLLPSANFWIFGPDHPRLSLLSYDDIFALGRLSLRWLNQNFLPIKFNHVHVNLGWIFIELHLRIFSKFQSSFVYG